MQNKPISSSDPEAIPKLQEKLESMQKAQVKMRTVNAYYRKHGTCQGCDGVDAAKAAKLDELAAKPRYGENKPYLSYDLTNNNANIKSTQGRITELTRKKEVGFVGWEFEGGEAVANTELDRLQLIFEEKPNDVLRNTLKRNGFKWAPSQGAWQRHLNENAIHAADCISALIPIDGKSVRAVQPKTASRSEQGAR